MADFREVDVERSERFWTCRASVEEKLFTLKGHAAWRVWAVLSSMADVGGSSFPSVRYVAERTGMTEQSVRNGLEALKAVGIVTVQHRNDDAGQPRSNLYTVLTTIGAPSRFEGDPQADLRSPPQKPLRDKDTHTEQDSGNNGRVSLGTKIWLLADRTSVMSTMKGLAPLPFTSDAFVEQLIAWADFRRSEKRNPLTWTSLIKQLRQCKDYGEAGAIASMEQSMSAGWLGLFEPKGAMRQRPLGSEGQSETDYDAER
jgi:hypothetical protein